MTWPLVGLVGVVLLAVVAGYAVWAWFGLQRAKGLRDSLRLEMESGAVKQFSSAIASHAEALEKLKSRINMMASEGKLR